MEAVAKLNAAGIPCSVLMGPVIPGLSDRPEQIDAVVREAVEAGATSIAPITLHLRPVVKDLFMRWLAEHQPDLLDTYRRLYPRSYAPKRVQDRIAALVSDALVRYGRPPKQPGHRQPIRLPPSRPAPSAAQAALFQPNLRQ
jgi:DNA repair photolyase